MGPRSCAPRLPHPPVSRRLRMREHLPRPLPVEPLLGHHGALAPSVPQHFTAHSRPLVHIHRHTSFLMCVAVLVRPFRRSGFHPAFTTRPQNAGTSSFASKNPRRACAQQPAGTTRAFFLAWVRYAPWPSRWMTPSKAEPGEASSPGVSSKTFALASGSPVEDNVPPRPRVTPPLSLGRFAPARLKIAYRGFIHLRVAAFHQPGPHGSPDRCIPLGPRLHPGARASGAVTPHPLVRWMPSRPKSGG